MKALIDANGDINSQLGDRFTAVMLAAQVLCVIVHVVRVPERVTAFTKRGHLKGCATMVAPMHGSGSGIGCFACFAFFIIAALPPPRGMQNMQNMVAPKAQKNFNLFFSPKAEIFAFFGQEMDFSGKLL